jgi:hypothetical protein
MALRDFKPDLGQQPTVSGFTSVLSPTRPATIADFKPDLGVAAATAVQTPEPIQVATPVEEAFQPREARVADLKGFFGEERTDSVLQNIGLELEDLKTAYITLGGMLIDDPLDTIKTIATNFGPAMVESYERWIDAAQEGRFVEALEKYPVQAIQDLTLPLAILAGGSGAILKAGSVGGQTGAKIAAGLAKTAKFSNVVGTIADPVGGAIGFAGQKVAGKAFRKLTKTSVPGSTIVDDLAAGAEKTNLENAIERRLVTDIGMPIDQARKTVDQITFNPDAFANSPELSNVLNEALDEVSSANIIRDAKGNLPQSLLDDMSDSILSGRAKEFEFTIGPDGKRIQPVARHNLNNINGTEDTKKIIATLAQKMENEIDDAVRGRVPWAKTEALARSLKLTPKDVLSIKKGSAKNASEILATAMVRDEAMVSMLGNSYLAREIPTDLNNAKFKKSLDLFTALDLKVTGVGSEAGRALEILKKIPPLEKATAKVLREIIENNGGKKNIQDIANAMADLELDQISRFAKDMVKPTGWDKFREWWLSSLLSGLTTQVVNLGSNALVFGYTQGLENLATVAVGKISRPIESVFGVKRSATTVAEAAGRLRGMGTGFTKAARDSLKVFVTGDNSHMFSPLEMGPRNAIKGLKGYVVRTPLRMLEAGDTFFKTLNYSSELNGLAVRRGMEAIEKGNLAKSQLNKFVADTIADPPNQLRNAAMAKSRYNTFTNPLGGDFITEGAKWIQTGRNNKFIGKPLQLLIPFVRTPANIMKFAVERTPFAILMKDTMDAIKAGGIPRDTALARIGMGTALAWFATDLAMKDRDFFGNDISITGGMSTSRKERDLQYASDFQPYSIRINDTFFSYARFEPLASIVGISADFAHLYDVMDKAQLDGNQKDMEKIPAMIAASFAKNLTSKTYMRGLSEGIKAFDDPDRNMGRFAASLGATIVPTGVAQYTRFNDPLLRDARSLIEKIRARIPGQSEKLPARVNIWGDDIRRETPLSFINPVYMKTAKHDKTTAEMIRLEVFPGMVGRKISGVKLTSDQYRTYARIAGQWAKQQLDAYTHDPSWENQSDLAKADILDKIIQDKRRKARRFMINDDLELRAEIIKRKQVR